MMASSAAPPRRRRLVGVSTKMYFSYAQTLSYVSSVLEHLSAGDSQGQDDLLLSQVDVFVIPDHVSLAATAALLKNTRILPGAQDAHHEDRGAFTGEVSPAVLAEVGCRIVELGHAERRRLFGESDADAARKAAAAALEGIGRNPAAAKELFTPMLLSLALIESLVIYSLVISFILSGKL